MKFKKNEGEAFPDDLPDYPLYGRELDRMSPTVENALCWVIVCGMLSSFLMVLWMVYSEP